MVDPHGLELIFEYICGNYGSLSFYIQENGQSVVLVTRALRYSAILFWKKPSKLQNWIYLAISVLIVHMAKNIRFWHLMAKIKLG